MSNEYASTTVSELRRMLVETGKYSVERAEEIKGKNNLITALLEMKNGEEDQDLDFTKLVKTIEPVNHQADTINLTPHSNDNIIVPDYNSIEWHDFVMTQFSENELIDNHPNIHGLRRVSELLLGQIVQSGPVSLFPPCATDTNVGRASCIYSVVFNLNDGRTVDFRAAAGASIHNTDDGYNIFPECIAETRAEARALRKALKLRCVSSEEVPVTGKKPEVETSSTGEWNENDKISAAQIMFIKPHLKEKNIDLDKFLKHYNYGDSLELINRKQALEIVALINDFQTNTKTSKDIPAEILKS